MAFDPTNPAKVFEGLSPQEVERLLTKMNDRYVELNQELKEARESGTPDERLTPLIKEINDSAVEINAGIGLLNENLARTTAETPSVEAPVEPTATTPTTSEVTSPGTSGIPSTRTMTDAELKQNAKSIADKMFRGLTRDSALIQLQRIKDLGISSHENAFDLQMELNDHALSSTLTSDQIEDKERHLSESKQDVEKADALINYVNDNWRKLGLGRVPKYGERIEPILDKNVHKSIRRRYSDFQVNHPVIGKIVTGTGVTVGAVLLWAGIKGGTAHHDDTPVGNKDTTCEVSTAGRVVEGLNQEGQGSPSPERIAKEVAAVTREKDCTAEQITDIIDTAERLVAQQTGNVATTTPDVPTTLVAPPQSELPSSPQTTSPTTGQSEDLQKVDCKDGTITAVVPKINGIQSFYPGDKCPVEGLQPGETVKTPDGQAFARGL